MVGEIPFRPDIIARIFAPISDGFSIKYEKILKEGTDPLRNCVENCVENCVGYALLFQLN